MKLAGNVTMPKELFYHEFLNREPRCKKAAFYDLWFMANDTARSATVRGIDVPLKRGQFARAQASLAAEWRWSKDKVKAFLIELQDERLITFESSNTVTIITVLDYTVYNPDSAALKDAETDAESTTETTPNRTQNPHGIGNREIGNRKGEGAPPSETVIPTDLEVETFCTNYPGNLAKGIPAKIPDGWWRDWLAFKLEQPERFPNDWQRAIKLKFEADFVNRHPKALSGLMPIGASSPAQFGKNGGHLAVQPHGEVSASVAAIAEQKKRAELQCELNELRANRDHERGCDIEPDRKKMARLRELENLLANQPERLAA